MTMLVRIKNEDLQRTASVVIQDFVMGRAAPTEARNQPLGPGETLDVYIHSSRRFIVSEDPNAIIPAKKAGEQG